MGIVTDHGEPQDGSRQHADVPSALNDRLRSICFDLPDVVEEQAWVGTRWVIRKKNFAHVVAIDDGWPPAYAAAAGTDGPAVVLTFRTTGIELDALRNAGPPFFKPVWFDDIAGIILDESTDWDEVSGLVVDSYCTLAPRRLVDEVRTRRRSVD